MTPICRTDSYITDVPYPDYFHREVTPVWLCSTLQALGRITPSLHQPYTWLELGCGTGISTLVAAASNPLGQFIGLDINPDAIAQAQALAQAGGLKNVRFLHCSFEEALHLSPALPHCDFIVSHGVYSWISPNNRAAMRQLIAHHLKPSGIVYLGYMSQPGSASMAAAQKLVHLVTAKQTDSAQGKVHTGLSLLESMTRSGAGYFSEYPRLAHEVLQLRGMDHRYVAHEFLNAHWESLHVADVMTDMLEAGCEYAGSATPLENIDGASLPEDMLPLLEQLRAQGASVAVQETFKDMARNQNQRRDIYQRMQPESLVLSTSAHRQALLGQRVALLPTAPDLHGPLPNTFTLGTRIGPVHMPMAHVLPVLQALEKGPQSYAQLIQHPLYAQQPGSVSQLLQLLAWAGWIHFVRPDWQAGETAQTPAHAFNTVLAQRLCGQPATPYIVTPLLGSAIASPEQARRSYQQQRLRHLGSMA